MGLCGHQEIQAIQRDLGQHTLYNLLMYFVVAKDDHDHNIDCKPVLFYVVKLFGLRLRVKNINASRFASSKAKLKRAYTSSLMLFFISCSYKS